MATPKDSLVSQQWHLPMLGNMSKIWADYTGRGVHVVVYDDGLQTGHPDIAANYDASMEFRYGGVTYRPTPLGSEDNHGTSVAGLIGAVGNNGIGGAGVAYGVSLTAVNYLSDLQSSYDYDAGTSTPFYDAVMKWAARFDVMSNSWDLSTSFTSDQNMNNIGGLSQTNARLFEWVAAHGRGGLGTVVVKAAGNETHNVNGDASEVSRHTITVAAVQRNGFVTDYSNFGTPILIAGPEASVTTDRTGNNGYNTDFDSDPLNPNYTSTFNGTSAATPVVSGVVALMLDANAHLGWRDVADILAMSAAHTGSAFGSDARGYEQDVWQSMGGTHWNGGGAEYNQSYGYGFVDGYAAVRMAEAWGKLYDNATRTSANEKHVTYTYSGAPVFIPDNGGASGDDAAEIDFNVRANVEVETVYVTVTVQHGYAADLVMGVIDPNGTASIIANKEINEGPINDTWTFAIEAYRGMSAKGTWTLAVQDTDSSDTGYVKGVKLEFFGAGDTVNDVYHFTDDFKMMRNAEADRRVLDDSNGGIDWLNFAAVTANLNVNMVAGGAVKFNGTQLAKIASGTSHFENLYAGDGNDRIAGNGLKNVIYGARGNDVLIGAGGDDSLNGGSGSDRLFGGTGRDRLTGGSGSDELTGGTGADSFVFAKGSATDTVLDFKNDFDTLRLDHALWSGTKTVSQVLSHYAHIERGVGVVLDFGHGNYIVLEDFTSKTALANDIVIY